MLDLIPLRDGIPVTRLTATRYAHSSQLQPGPGPVSPSAASAAIRFQASSGGTRTHARTPRVQVGEAGPTSRRILIGSAKDASRRQRTAPETQRRPRLATPRQHVARFGTDIAAAAAALLDEGLPPHHAKY